MANDTLIDYSLLKSQLSRSKLQVTNPSAHQTIDSLIGGVQAFQDFTNVSFAAQQQNIDAITKINNQLQKITAELAAVLASNAIYLYEVDCSAGPVTIDPTDPTVWPTPGVGWLLIKDYLGFAFTNPITVLGNIDGVDNPIFFTDYDKIRIYLSPTDGLYKTW